MIDVPSVRIWNEAPHSAFTDLVRFADRFYCCFREGNGHVPGEEGSDGTARVIASADGVRWKSVAKVAAEGVDLRDPKLSVTPDGRLMMVMGGSVYDGKTLTSRTPRVSFSNPEGTAFGPALIARIDPAVARDNDWLWRVTWHGGTAWGVVYQPSNESWGLQLVTSTDGLDWKHVGTLDVGGWPNEATVRFLPDDTMVIVVRRERGDRTGFIGYAAPPYQEWTWSSLGVRLGGPDFVRLPDGSLVCGTRAYGEGPRGEGIYSTILARVELDGTFTHLADFPSRGDTSYPGLVVYGDELWVSYYSTHGAKSAIYLARVPLRDLRRDPNGERE